MTSVPLRASARAVLRPSPRLAPVIRAILGVVIGGMTGSLAAGSVGWGGLGCHELATGAAPNCLGWLSECSEEGTPHPLAIGEAGLGGHDVNGMPGLLHHEPGRLDPQVLDGLGR